MTPTTSMKGSRVFDGKPILKKKSTIITIIAFPVAVIALVLWYVIHRRNNL